MPRIKVRKNYSNYNPLYVYMEEYHQLSFEELEEYKQDCIYELELRERGVKCHYATKEIYSGEMLEIKVYPCFISRTDYSRAKTIERIKARQKALNDRYAREKLVRLVNTNFFQGDYSLTVGYQNNNQPPNLKACKKDGGNLIRRVKYHMENSGLKAGDLKYLYVIETVEKAAGTHYHIHFLFSANAGSNRKGVDKRDFLESLWDSGRYPQTRQLKIAETGGFTGISTYMTDQFEEFAESEPNSKRWGSSQKLKRHDRVRKTFRKWNKRRVNSVVEAPATLRELFEKDYPDYQYNGDYPAEIKYNKEIDGNYIYCRMYRKKQYKPRN